MTPTDDEIEAVARALFACAWAWAGHDVVIDFDTEPREEREGWKLQARAAIACYQQSPEYQAMTEAAANWQRWIDSCVKERIEYKEAREKMLADAAIDAAIGDGGHK